MVHSLVFASVCVFVGAYPALALFIIPGPEINGTPDIKTKTITNIETDVSFIFTCQRYRVNVHLVTFHS
jgi:hypothetical protein